MLGKQFIITDELNETYTVIVEYQSTAYGNYVLAGNNGMRSIRHILQHDPEKLAAKRRIMKDSALPGDAIYSYIFSETNPEVAAELRELFPELLI